MPTAFLTAPLLKRLQTIIDVKLSIDDYWIIDCRNVCFYPLRLKTELLLSAKFDDSPIAIQSNLLHV
jgi:hypothetical protein